MKNLVISFLLLLHLNGYTQTAYLIDEDVAVFYPSDFDAEKNLPSFILENEPQKYGNLPSGWNIIPQFYTEDGKSCVRISTENGTDIYGTGEVYGPLLRNGQTVTLWNRDNSHYTAYDGKRLYQSHPWVLCVRENGSSYGIIYDNTWKQEITTEQTITAKSDGPPFRVIIIERNNPAEVLKELSVLSGNMPLPPLWSMGYHQSRWSYQPDSKVKEIANGFRSRNLPCDVIWLDIDYMDNFKVFTFDRNKFPNPGELNNYLHNSGFKAIYILDPGVKVEQNYFVYEQGVQGNYYITTPSGAEYHGDAWPGACAFPDFLNPNTRNWWASLHQSFMANGIDGVWCDMNEPSVYNGDDLTIPGNNIHKAGGGVPEDIHERYHNVYGMSMAQATQQGIMNANPNKRPFVLTRSNFLGGHRYAATWTGDNDASWSHLKLSIPMSINLGLSGQLFSGPDVGGFFNNPTSELYAHWISLGVFYPFYRSHAITGSINQEPWSFGTEIENVARTALNRRYRLLPYIYSCFFDGYKNGKPIMQPVFFADLNDKNLRDEEEVFLFGDNLLIIPKWADNPSLPSGNWRSISICGENSALDKYQPDVKMRPGSIVPLGEIIQSTAQYSANYITLLVSLDENGNASGYLYDDDHDNYNYKSNGYSITNFNATSTSNNINITISKTEGNYSIDNRQYRIGIVTNHQIFYTGWSGATSYTLPKYPDIIASINSPIKNSIIPSNQTTVSVSATSDFDAITKVELFYNNSVKLAEFTNPPYEYNWTNIPNGVYDVYAEVTSSSGYKYTVPPVNIIVGTFGDGTITRQVWNNITGSEISDLTLNSKYPDNPDQTEFLNKIEAPSNIGDNYGQRIIGYIQVPVEADYTFWIAGDDKCDLYLSTDQFYANRQKIAYVEEWSYPYQYDKYPAQISAPVHLYPNRKYLIEAIHKEGGYGDNLSVAWMFNNFPRKVIQSQFLSPYQENEDLTGKYYLQNRHSNLYMEVSGASTSNGANIQQNSLQKTTNQQFEFTSLGVNIYRIIPIHSGKAVDIDGVSAANGANVHQWDYVGGTNQQFSVVPTGNGYYKLIAVHSNKLIEVSGFSTTVGGNLQQWEDVNQSSGQWKLISVGGGGILSDGTYLIQNRNSGLYLDVDANLINQDGANVQQWQLYNTVNQKFTLTNLGSNTYSIISVASGKSLDVSGASTANGANVQQWAYVQVPQQQFNIVSVDNAYYKIIATHSNKLVEVAGFSTSNGGNIQQWEDAGQHSGHWQFIAAAKAAYPQLSEEDITIYPNPVKTTLTIKGNSSETDIEIYNTLGRKVLFGKGEQLNVEALSAGIYYLKIKSNSQMVTRTFIKN